jgi:hypothetical protein
MKILTTLALFCLMATAVHAGEPWPENVCRVLAGYEQRDIQRYGNNPVAVAFARSNVLNMLRVHCGVDTAAKIAADVAAAAASVPSQATSGDGVDHSIDVEIDSPRRSNSMHCTTMAMGGGLSATDCE